MAREIFGERWRWHGRFGREGTCEGERVEELARVAHVAVGDHRDGELLLNSGDLLSEIEIEHIAQRGPSKAVEGGRSGQMACIPGRDGRLRRVDALGSHGNAHGR